MNEVLKYLQPNAAVPIDMETTAMLVNALRQSIADLESQEPVAWKWRVKNFCDWPDWSVSLKRPADSGHAQYPRTEGYEDIPLYTTPPQRTWVGLTPEEFHEACWESYVDPVTGECSTGDREYAVRWTEAKLKEKNT
jgi:hypothetical protein